MLYAEEQIILREQIDESSAAEESNLRDEREFFANSFIIRKDMRTCQRMYVCESQESALLFMRFNTDVGSLQVFLHTNVLIRYIRYIVKSCTLLTLIVTFIDSSFFPPSVPIVSHHFGHVYLRSCSLEGSTSMLTRVAQIYCALQIVDKARCENKPIAYYLLFFRFV